MGGLVNTFQWSLGRLQKYETCQRMFYYNYYGYWNGWKDTAHYLTRVIYFLKNLDSYNIFVGNSTHSMISNLLKREIDNNEDQFNKEKIYSEIKEIVNSKFKNSFNNLNNKSLESIIKTLPKLKNVGFKNHFYDNIDIKDKIQDSITNQIYANVISLHNSELYRFSIENLVFSKTNNLPYRIEAESVDFDKDTFLHTWKKHNIKCYAKPDFYFTTKARNKVVILDWKTGVYLKNKKSEILTSQLMLYGYKVFKDHTDYFKSNEDASIEAYEVHLPSCEMSGGVVNEYHFVNIIKRIDEDLHFLSNLIVDKDVKKNRAKDISFYKKSSNDKVCNICNYRKICND